MRITASFRCHYHLQRVNLLILLNVASPDRALPGEVPFNEGCLSIVWWILFGTDVISKRIEVPQLTVLEMVTEELEIIAQQTATQELCSSICLTLVTTKKITLWI